MMILISLCDFPWWLLWLLPLLGFIIGWFLNRFLKNKRIGVLESKWNTCISNKKKLQEDYDTLNFSYKELKGDFSLLNNRYNELSSNYKAIQDLKKVIETDDSNTSLTQIDVQEKDLPVTDVSKIDEPQEDIVKTNISKADIPMTDISKTDIIKSNIDLIGIPMIDVPKKRKPLKDKIKKEKVQKVNPKKEKSKSEKFKSKKDNPNSGKSNSEKTKKKKSNKIKSKVKPSLKTSKFEKRSIFSSQKGDLNYDIHANLKNDNLQIIEGIGPKMEALLKKNNVNTWADLSFYDGISLRHLLDSENPKIYKLIDPTTWGEQARYAASGNWNVLTYFQRNLETVRTIKIGKTDAKVEKVMMKLGFLKKWKKDDLKAIEGIGRKIEKLFLDAGIKSWKTLSETSVGRLKEILKTTGDRFRLADPSSWPEQARMANEGLWDKLKEYQDFLRESK